MSDKATIVSGNDGAELLMNSYRPLVTNEDGKIYLSGFKKVNGEFVRDPEQPVINSMLREDEWETIDAAVLGAAHFPLFGIADLRARGLVESVSSIGTLLSTWYMSSELTAAERNMTGRARGTRDLPDMTQASVPLPVTFKEFGVDARFLAASRLMGNGIDTTTAVEAARVVAESLEDLLFNGDTGVNFQGNVVYGYTNHPDRATDTAGNYGGGDCGTIANITPTIGGMLQVVENTNRHYGPFVCYISETQYDQAAQTYYSDGSNAAETALMRLKRTYGTGSEGTGQITAFKKMPANILADGNILLVQMTSDVVVWSETFGPQVREWRTGDGMESNWRVMTIAAPKIKARQDGKSGIVHATGA